MISVIIVSKNRDEALKTLSLPSLLLQDTGDFEVIIWDASDTDASEKVCEKFSPYFREKGIPFNYIRAPRSGIASQRNDAASRATGEIIFFIDDDSEVSVDGISSLRDGFEKNRGCMGGGLVLFEASLEEKKSPRKERWKNILYDAVGYIKTRKVHPSGSSGGSSAPPGPAEWLSGGSMAYRRQVFDVISFNEKLETFGPYAVAEDVEFSYKVFLHYRLPLIIFPGGKVKHYPWAGGRTYTSEKNIATLFYNRYLLMTLASKRAPFRGRIAFSWNLLRRFFLLSLHNGFSVTQKGLTLAVKKILEDKAERKNEEKRDLGK